MKSLAPFAVALIAATLSLAPSAFQGETQAQQPAKPAIVAQEASVKPLIRVPARESLKKTRATEFVAPQKIAAAPVNKWLADDARHPAQPANIDELIEREAKKNGVDPLLIATIVKFESAGNPYAESWVGAQGLMQMMPETAAEMGVTNPTDPEDNIRGGARYFGLMMETFGDPRLALAAYNAGPGAVQQYGGVPPYEETRHYVENIYGEYARRAMERGVDPTGFSG